MFPEQNDIDTLKLEQKLIKFLRKISIFLVSKKFFLDLILISFFLGLIILKEKGLTLQQKAIPHIKHFIVQEVIFLDLKFGQSEKN